MWDTLCLSAFHSRALVRVSNESDFIEEVKAPSQNLESEKSQPLDQTAKLQMHLFLTELTYP